MKRLSPGIFLLSWLIVVTAWAHHAAQGIVSDEIWYMIDENLQEADSPHLDMDLTNMLSTIGSVEDVLTGDMYLESYVEVYFDDVSVLDPEYYINTFLETIVADTVDESNRIPSGTLDSNTREVQFKVIYIDDDGDDLIDYAEVYMYEPIGSGNSQVGVTPSQPPGKRAGG